MTTVANISLIYVDVDDLVTMCIPGMQKKAYIIKTEKKTQRHSGKQAEILCQ